MAVDPIREAISRARGAALPVFPPKPDPIRRMVAAQRARVPVRLFGFSAGSPDIEDDPEVMLGRAVARQAQADLLTARRPRTARAAMTVRESMKSATRTT